MATVIDELIVVLNLDPSQFTDAQKEALANFQRTRDEAEKTGKQLEAQGKRAAEFYSQIKKEALGLFAVVVGQGSLDSYIRTQTQALVDLGVAAKNTGVAVRELSGWAQVVTAQGGNSSISQATLTTLATTLERWKTGRGLPGVDFMNAFSMIGGQTSDATNPVAVIRKLAAAKERFHWSDEFTAQQGRALGLDPYSISEAERGTAALDRDYARAQKNAPDNSTIKAAQDLKDAFTDLRSQGVHALNKDLEALDKVAGPGLRWVADLVGKFPVLTGVVGGAAAIFVTLSTAMVAFRTALWGITGRTGAAAAAGGAAGGGAVSGALGPVGIALAGAGLVELSGDPENLAAYKAVLGNPKTATLAQLHQALAHIRTAINQTPKERANIPLFARFTDQANMIKSELRARGDTSADGPGGAAAPSSAAPTASPAVGGGGALNRFKAYLTGHGVDEGTASGITAGVYAESGGRPGAVNSTSGAGGLLQLLTPSRVANFRKMFGHDPKNGTPEEMAAFFLWETQAGGSEAAAGRAIRGAGGNPYQAMLAMLSRYERPGAGVGGDIIRGSHYLSQSPKAVQIGTIVINTKATDAHGIAKDIRKALQQGNLANRGLE